MKQGENMTPAGMPDVQGRSDARRIAIDRVGIRAIRHPVRVSDGGEVQTTVATFAMSVALPHQQRGTHMSRFIEILHGMTGEVTAESFMRIVRDMTARLEAASGYVEMKFPWFVSKTAPVSGAASLMDYQVSFHGSVDSGEPAFVLRVAVPVTSLCPCSKEISQYGAHTQRSELTISVRASTAVQALEIIRIAEQEASSELYGLLKRGDEKFVTEHAYDHPKFVEDLVRDVAARLESDRRIRGYRVECENFESIHNHSAFAIVERNFDDR